MKIKLFFSAMFITGLAFTAQAMEVTVKDGDSLEIGERRIRLDGLDAPEFTQICQNALGEDYECGKEALHYLEKLTAGKDVECSCLAEKDRYKREICECFADEVSLNREMVVAGYAVAYRDKTYSKEEDIAKQNKAGIWQGKHMRPTIYRVLHRAEVKTVP